MTEKQNLFATSPVNITAERKRHLGGVISSTEYRDEYVIGTTNNQLAILSTIAENLLIYLFFV